MSDAAGWGNGRHLEDALLLVSIDAAEQLPDGRMLRLHGLCQGLHMIGLAKGHLKAAQVS